VHQSTLWRPDYIQRNATWHKYLNNTLTSFALSSRTAISATTFEVYQELRVRNRLTRPLRLTLIPDQASNPRRFGDFERVTDTNNVTVVAVADVGPASADGWPLVIAPGQTAVVHIALAFNNGTVPPPSYYDDDVGRRYLAAVSAANARLDLVSQSVPRLNVSNAALAQYYARSVLSVVLCRLDSPAVYKQPFYALGSHGGMSVSWDLSFSSALIAHFDPAGLAIMVRAFFDVDIWNHCWIRVDGAAFGFYAQSPFAALKMLRDYVAATGDVSALGWEVGPTNETTLAQLVRVARLLNTTYARPGDGLLDLGAGTGVLLEIQTSGAEYVIASVSGLAVTFYRQVAELCDLQGGAAAQADAAALRAIATALATSVNAHLWNDAAGWCVVRGDEYIFLPPPPSIY
jgi:hypothetical protein